MEALAISTLQGKADNLAQSLGNESDDRRLFRQLQAYGPFASLAIEKRLPAISVDREMAMLDMLIRLDQPAGLKAAHTLLRSKTPVVRDEAIRATLWLTRPQSYGIHGEPGQLVGCEPIVELGEDAIPALENLAKQPRLTYSAATTLCLIDSPKVVDALLRIIADCTGWELYTMAERLVRSSDPRVYPALVKQIEWEPGDYAGTFVGMVLARGHVGSLIYIADYAAEIPPDTGVGYHLARTVSNMSGPVDAELTRLFDTGGVTRKIGVLRIIRGRTSDSITKIRGAALKHPDARVREAAKGSALISTTLLFLPPTTTLTWMPEFFVRAENPCGWKP